MKKHNKKAFTLVELVVVVAVLLILAAIAIPIVGGVINNAHIATDESNAKSIETAIKYAIAHNEIGDEISGTVGDALELSGMETADILDAEQSGYGFYYDNIGQSVVPLTAPRTANDILLDGTNVLNANGTVGAGSGPVIPPTNVDLVSFAVDPATISKIASDADFALGTVITPTNATNTGTTWATSNDLVATVSGGTVHIVGVGNATITATLAGTTGGATNTATCVVTVTAAPVNLSSFSITPTSIIKTETDADFDLTPHIDPLGATNTGITWGTSDASVVTVAGGTVHIVGDGTATITATLNGTTGGASNTATCAVTVNAAAVPASLTLNFSPASINVNIGSNVNLDITATPTGIFSWHNTPYSPDDYYVYTVGAVEYRIGIDDANDPNESYSLSIVNSNHTLRVSITGVSVGTATLTATFTKTTGGSEIITKDCEITVTTTPVNFAFLNTSYSPITSITVKDYDDNGSGGGPHSGDSSKKLIAISITSPSPAGNNYFSDATHYVTPSKTYTVSYSIPSGADATCTYEDRDNYDNTYGDILWLEIQGINQSHSGNRTTTLTVTFTSGTEVVSKTFTINITD